MAWFFLIGGLLSINMTNSSFQKTILTAVFTAVIILLQSCKNDNIEKIQVLTASDNLPLEVGTNIILNYTDSGLIFVLMGKQAQELEGMIGEHHHIIKVSHPASAAYTKTTWDCGDMFNEINKIINGQNGPTFKINW